MIAFVRLLSLVCLVLYTRTCKSDVSSKSIAAAPNGTDNSYSPRQERHLSITDQDIESAFEVCMKDVEQHKQLEKDLVSKGRVVPQNRVKTDISMLRRRKTDPRVHSLEYLQMPFVKVTDNLANKFSLSSSEIDNELRNLPMNGMRARAARNDCDTGVRITQSCNFNTRYRTADGTCNNLRNPTWGSVNRCFNRLLPARYEGSSGFRRSVYGSSLPNPRILSQDVHQQLNRPTNYVTHMYTFFGQLLDHDISMTPLSMTMGNQAIECCPPSPNSHPQCAPIDIDPNDSFYSRFNVRCLNFVRSAVCPSCVLGHREQMNQITAFIDASFVYGNSLNETSGLRANDGTGRLRVRQSSVGDLLPDSPDPQNDQCSFPNMSLICFEAGDPRANQHRTLASLHTIFVREHNRIATQLRLINPHWDEETLFQESRRILGAQMQAITFKEYLPITLGSDRMSYFGLFLSKNSWTNYNPSLDPTLMSEFSTAAFRFGHSLINSLVHEYSRSDSQRLLRNEFFQPFDLRSGSISPLLSDVSRSPAQFFDRYLVQDVTNFLYRIRGNQTGLDLAAINIQRGRDHGMPTYKEAVRYCSENKLWINNFDDLVREQLMTLANMRLLSRNYRHVDDIDLWTGILSETPNDNAVVGPTGICIIGFQFNKLKYGDRFYFQHRNQRGSFTYQQLGVLRKATLSEIICANTDIAQMPMNAMIFTGKNNPLIDCRYARGIDLSYWRE